MAQEEKLVLSDAEWRARLTPDRYRVLRRKGTEPAFDNEYCDLKAEGTYHCAGCGSPLFSSEVKFDSGSGWPSFREPLSPDALKEEEDRSLVAVRTEIKCARCEGHLGHVFDDGPEPAGLRYCMNSASLEFRAKD